MSLFERLSNNSLKSQAKETGVPAPILKKVYNRGVDDGKKTAPWADTDAWGKARVASFVRGGADREKDTDLWNKYQQEPQAEAAKIETVVTLPNNEAEAPKAGIFLVLPDTIARYFPKKEGEDTSAPHVTLLYIGPVTPEQEKKLVSVVRTVADRWPPFRVDLTKYSEFVNKEGMTIANMVPAAAIGLSSEVFRGLGHLHADLFAALEDAGIDVKHDYGGEKSATFDERVEMFKPHTTLAYVPAGEKYTGPMPTGSWHANELEIWGHDKYRIPLGLKIQPSYTVPTTSTPVEDETPDEPTIELRVETVQAEPAPAVIEPAKAEESANPSSQTSPAVSLFRQLGVAARAAKVETPAPIQKPEVLSLPEVTQEASKAAGLASADVDPPELPTKVETRSPWRPVRLFESFGYFEGSVLDYGGVEDHEFARFNVLSEDHDAVNRRWKTIVCGHLHEQTPFGQTSTLLAIRGLLKRDGKALVAMPAGQQVDEWEEILDRFFTTKRLPVKGMLAWQLSPLTSETVEEAQVQLPAPVAPVLPPIHFHMPPMPAIPPIEFPPMPVPQIHMAAPQFNMPAPEITIGPGAIALQVDVHAPPSVKKRVVMSKDSFGRVTGELETVSDEPAKRPEFPNMEELMAGDGGGLGPGE